MPNRVIAILFLLVGIINFYPLIGIMGASRLATLYGITLDDPNLLLLMRHRAMLFGIIGGFIMYAAFQPQLRVLASVIGLVSMLSFVVLILFGDSYNTELQRVFIADIAASVLLGTAVTLQVMR